MDLGVTLDRFNWVGGCGVGGVWGLWLLNISDVMQCQNTPPPPPSFCGLNQVGMRYISSCSTCSEQAAAIRSLDRMGSPDLKQQFFPPKESRADAVGGGGGAARTHRIINNGRLSKHGGEKLRANWLMEIKCR